MKRVFIAGEGRNELGGRAAEPPWTNPEPGFIEAFMRNVSPDGWEVAGARAWKRLVSLRIGKGRGPKEKQNVQAAILFAVERECDVVALLRDRDRDKDRQAWIEAGLELARQRHGDQIEIAAAVVIECLEAWVLALAGTTKTEKLSVPGAKSKLGPVTTEQMVAQVESSDLSAIANDAHSLRRWHSDLAAALGVGQPEQRRSAWTPPLTYPMILAMRRALVAIFLLTGSCAEDGDDANPQCEDCDNHESCPSGQPTINPLVSCDTVDAQCFYCDQVMRRFVCQDDGNGNLNWMDAGEADMCPPPPDDTGDDGDGGTG
jgi:hypothetical protein